MAHRVPQQQEHTVPGLGRIGGSRGSHGGGDLYGNGGRSEVAEGRQRRGNELARQQQRPGHTVEPRQAPRRGGLPSSPAPAPVPGYRSKIPYQQQHEVPGLNLGGGEGALPIQCLWSHGAQSHASH